MTGIADFCNDLTLRYGLADRNQNRAAVIIPRDKTVAVVDFKIVTARSVAEVLGDHGTALRSDDIMAVNFTVGQTNINSVMHTAASVVRICTAYICAGILYGADQSERTRRDAG